MYNTTEKQSTSIQELEEKGFFFSNWIPYHPDAESQPVAEGDEVFGVAVMWKRAVTRFGREYCEVYPDGSIH